MTPHNQEMQPAPGEGARVALVTGSRTGIGRHLSERLLDQGWLVVGCSRKPAGWEAENYTHLEADVSKEEQVKAVFRHLIQHHGRLDALINCAAAASMNHVLLTPASTVEKIMGTNVGGTFLLCREAAKLMRKRKFGRIVNFTSAVVPLRLAGEAVYIASKSAVAALSQVLARELAEFGITVNVVGPGLIATDMLRGVPQAKIDQVLKSFPLPRMTTMEDVANVVDFFLRPESAAVTGQVVYLGGLANG